MVNNRLDAAYERKKEGTRVFPSSKSVAREIVEMVPCVYRQSADRCLWMGPADGKMAFIPTKPDIDGIDFADVVVPLNMGELMEIKEIT